MRRPSKRLHEHAHYSSSFWEGGGGLNLCTLSPRQALNEENTAVRTPATMCCQSYDGLLYPVIVLIKDNAGLGMRALTGLGGAWTGDGGARAGAGDAVPTPAEFYNG